MKIILCILLAALLLPAVSAAEGENRTREIPVTEVGPVFIGQAENAEAATGCTVFIAPQGRTAFRRCGTCAGSKGTPV